MIYLRVTLFLVGVPFESTTDLLIKTAKLTQQSERLSEPEARSARPSAPKRSLQRAFHSWYQFGLGFRVKIRNMRLTESKLKPSFIMSYSTKVIRTV